MSFDRAAAIRDAAASLTHPPAHIAAAVQALTTGAKVPPAASLALVELDEAVTAARRAHDDPSMRAARDQSARVKADRPIVPPMALPIGIGTMDLDAWLDWRERSRPVGPQD